MKVRSSNFRNPQTDIDAAKWINYQKNIGVWKVKSVDFI